MPIKKHSFERRAVQKQISDRDRGTARQRGYSTEWDKFAKGYLQGHPLCLYCATQGRTSASVLVDHIIPHRGDPDAFWPDEGEDWDLFFAPSCRECHDVAKQQAESIADRTGKDVRAILKRWGMLPDGFPGTDPDQAIRNAGAWIVTGPPAVGKSTYARSLKEQRRDAIIYDVDDIAEDKGLPRYGRDRNQATAAVHHRDMALLKHPGDRPLILVTGAPTPQEREYWKDRLHTEGQELHLVQLMEPRDLLIQRINARRMPEGAFQASVEAVDRWIALAGGR